MRPRQQVPLMQKPNLRDGQVLGARPHPRSQTSDTSSIGETASPTDFGARLDNRAHSEA